MENNRGSRPKTKRTISIDFGMARIGIAVSDATKIIAIPLATVTCEKKSEDTVTKVVLELQKHEQSHHYEIDEIVVGMPFLLSGKTGFLADEVNHFIEILKKSVTVPVIPWDERLTTVQAERSMREGQMTRKKRSKIVDKVAAVIILQNYLDHKKIQSYGAL